MMKRGREYLFVGLRDGAMGRRSRVPLRASPTPLDLTAFAAGMILGATLVIVGAAL